MGWASCGQDSRGREIGYTISATCDYEGCDAAINRGLDYVCGYMHGEDEYSCGGYFCGEHRQGIVRTDQGRLVSVCESCETLWEKHLEDNGLPDPRE